MSSYSGLVAFVREDGLLRHSKGGWSVGRCGDRMEIWTVDCGAIPFERVIGCYSGHEEAHENHPRARRAADAYGDRNGLLHPYPLFDSKFELVFGVRLPQARYEPPARLDGGLYLRPLDQNTIEFCDRRPIWFQEFFDGLRGGSLRGQIIDKNLIYGFVESFVRRFKAQWYDANVSVSTEIANQQVRLYGR